MQSVQRWTLLAIGLFCNMLLAPARAQSVSRAERLPLTAHVQLGLKDKVRTTWSGSVRISTGSAIIMPGPKQRRQKPGTTFEKQTVVTTQQAKKKKRKQNIRRPRLALEISAPQTARLTIETNHGTIATVLSSAMGAQPKSVLDGQATIQVFPPSVRLTSENTDDDWPAAARAPDGSTWVAYQSYTRAGKLDAKTIHEQRQFDSLLAKGNGDQVFLRRVVDGQSESPIPISGALVDVFRPSVAIDGRGGLWVVWSQNFNDNWELVARRYDPARKQLSAATRITDKPGADINPQAVTDPKTGIVYVVWQGWRGGSFDIFVAGVSQRMDRRPVYRSLRNEWNPSAAFDSQGRLHVALDTYEKGDYDVKLVSDALSVTPRVIDVAVSARFEARAHLAIDAEDRIWVAYEEGDVNWAKDFGTVWKGPSGVPFYLRREIRVRRISGTTVEATQGEIRGFAVNTRYTETRKPGALRRLSVPRIAFDQADRLWLVYRQHVAPSGNGTLWRSYATWYQGNDWAPPVALANSENQLDNRPTLLRRGDGGLDVIGSTDLRGVNRPGSGQNDVYMSTLRTAGPATRPQLVAVAAETKPAVSVHPNEQADIARLHAYQPRVNGRRAILLRGEFHRHTELTSHRDQDGLLEEIWRYALDVAQMDWLGNGDHNNGGKEYLWWLVQKETSIYSHPPTFTAAYTYERSVRYPSGHRNVMFARRGIRPLPLRPGGQEMVMGTPEKGSPDIKGLYAYLKHFRGICSSHTSATGMGTDWRDNDPEVEPVVEIYQGHRQNYEHYGAPGSATGKEDGIGGFQPAGFVWNAWKKGYRLGIQTSSDHVSTHLSYGIVYARDHSRQAIIDAFKQRHCYGANDNVLLDFRCADHMMGDEFSMTGQPEFEVTAVGTQPIVRVSIIRGVENETPTYVYNSEPKQRRVKLTWRDEKPAAGKTSYYYVRIEQTRPEDGFGALAWASPMWIHLQ